MSCGFYISPFLENFSCRIKEKCRTDDANIDFPIVFLLSDDSKLLMETSVYIRNELDTETTGSREFLMTCLSIFRYSDDVDTELGELSLETSEVLGFEGTARSIVLRVEVEEGLFRFLEIG